MRNLSREVDHAASPIDYDQHFNPNSLHGNEQMLHSHIIHHSNANGYLI